MTKRKALSKKNRFEVFKLDLFACQYCGSVPPLVVLEVDHIDPVSNGGTNDTDNLVTACFDCNRGKSDNLLSSVPASIEERRELLQEKEDQIKAFKKLKSSIKRRKTKTVNKVEAVFSEYFPCDSFSENARRTISTQYIDKIDTEDMEYLMQVSCSKGFSADRSIRYFFGCCWNRIKG